ncbi:DinB family protein [Amycolatopsis sp. K13G38]|uniref:DinB family protein n=1 Tax=Amycolatopsis acididurans TaxID=2724524 RepID=A0ABX1JB38_9PSEU|nr:DinB family protein [Amycolatopsis acididurans]NKQ57012.1 DinB family protein [Amycolatopsis acididurans]
MIDEERPEPPIADGEAATLQGFLDFQRATFDWKCAALDAAGLRATLAPSPMTLGGMLKHLAYVEDRWFSAVLWGQQREPWSTVDWAADPDWDWHSAADDSPEELRALWQESVTHSRKMVDAALAEGGLDQLARAAAWQDGRSPNLRWILCHMIEEYSRHNGHADLIRESIDGRTGE